jgi:hypothetical protein
MFKPTSRCRPPHLHADALRDELYQSEFLSRHNIKTAEELLLKLESINTRLGKRYNPDLSQSGPKKSGKGKKGAVEEVEESTNKGKLTEQAEAKAKQYEFYLGLDKSWIEA